MPEFYTWVILLRNQLDEISAKQLSVFAFRVLYARSSFLLSDHICKIIIFIYTRFVSSQSVFCYRKCRHKKTELPFAVKIISKRVDVNREVTLLKLCQGHANIIQLIDVFYDEVSSFVNIPTCLNIVDWDVKHNHKQTKLCCCR